MDAKGLRRSGYDPLAKADGPNDTSDTSDLSDLSDKNLNLQL